MPDMPQDGDHLLLPTRSTLVPTPIEDDANEQPPPIVGPSQPDAPGTKTTEPAPNAVAAAMRAAFAVTVEKPKMLAAPRVGGRPSISDDPGARALYDKAVAVRAKNPTWAWADVAEKIGISERQLRRYRNHFN
jgi:hypothetical protein